MSSGSLDVAETLAKYGQGSLAHHKRAPVATVATPTPLAPAPAILPPDTCRVRSLVDAALHLPSAAPPMRTLLQSGMAALHGLTHYAPAPSRARRLRAPGTTAARRCGRLLSGCACVATTAAVLTAACVTFCACASTPCQRWQAYALRAWQPRPTTMAAFVTDSQPFNTVASAAGRTNAADADSTMARLACAPPQTLVVSDVRTAAHSQCSTAASSVRFRGGGNAANATSVSVARHANNSDDVHLTEGRAAQPTAIAPASGLAARGFTTFDSQAAGISHAHEVAVMLSTRSAAAAAADPPTRDAPAASPVNAGRDEMRVLQSLQSNHVRAAVAAIEQHRKPEAGAAATAAASTSALPAIKRRPQAAPKRLGPGLTAAATAIDSAVAASPAPAREPAAHSGADKRDCTCGGKRASTSAMGSGNAPKSAGPAPTVRLQSGALNLRCAAVGASATDQMSTAQLSFPRSETPVASSSWPSVFPLSEPPTTPGLPRGQPPQWVTPAICRMLLPPTAVPTPPPLPPTSQPSRQTPSLPQSPHPSRHRHSCCNHSRRAGRASVARDHPCCLSEHAATRCCVQQYFASCYACHRQHRACQQYPCCPPWTC